MTRRGNNEGTIRKRPDGRWEARVTVQGKQRSVYGKTREAVARKLREVQKLADEGLPIASERLMVAAYLEEWLSTSVKPSVRPSTYISYDRHVHRYVIPVIGKKVLNRLQPADVQRLLNGLLAQGLSSTTVQHVRASLRKALNQALRWGLVSRNVATLIDPPKSVRYRVEPLSPEEALALLQAFEQHRLGPLYTLMLGTGLRLGEASGLRWPDVDVDTGRITVRHALQRVDGSLTLLEPKSTTSRRTITVPGFVTAALRRQRAQQDGERLLVGDRWQETGFVFTAHFGTPVDPHNTYRQFINLLAEHQLRRIRLHDLRHGCATLLLTQDVNPRVVMEMLGHSQISLTLNTYSHVLPSLQADAAKRLDELLGGGQ